MAQSVILSWDPVLREARERIVRILVTRGGGLTNELHGYHELLCLIRNDLANLDAAAADTVLAVRPRRAPLYPRSRLDVVGEMREIGDWGGGPYLVCDRLDGRMKVYRPDCEPKPGDPPGWRQPAEMAGYYLSRRFGLGCVPKTQYVRDGPLGSGTVQDHILSRRNFEVDDYPDEFAHPVGLLHFYLWDTDGSFENRVNERLAQLVAESPGKPLVFDFERSCPGDTHPRDNSLRPMKSDFAYRYQGIRLSDELLERVCPVTPDQIRADMRRAGLGGMSTESVVGRHIYVRTYGRIPDLRPWRLIEP